MIYCFDLDGTLCSQTKTGLYTDATPFAFAIDELNRLFGEGHEVKIFTARGSSSGRNLRDLTEKQLEEWGVKYHELILKKPSYDIIIDDKAISADDWHQSVGRRGFIAGCFDVIHPGYVKMFEDAKNVCDWLIVGLQSDPTIDRPDSHKVKPVQTLDEREIILSGIKWVDEIYTYNTEAELYQLLRRLSPDIRILGSDHAGKPYNGDDLGIDVYFHERNHDWSSTELKRRIRA